MTDVYPGESGAEQTEQSERCSDEHIEYLMRREAHQSRPYSVLIESKQKL